MITTALLIGRYDSFSDGLGIFIYLFVFFCMCGGVGWFLERRRWRVLERRRRERGEGGWGLLTFNIFMESLLWILGNAEDTVGSYGTLSNANILHAKGGNRTPPWKVEI